MAKVSPISAFNDNYIWLIESAAGAIVIDPGDAAPVIEQLQQFKRPLIAVLITHHHHDHTGGVKALRQAYPELVVYGPAKEAQAISDIKLQQGDTLTLANGEITFNIIELPGHTLGHIAYYGENWLFCGDTLFSGGCGRLFEGSAEQMYSSLEKLLALPDETLLFPAHEYTSANLLFARQIEPDNAALLSYQDEVNKLRAVNQPTLPSTLMREKAINPFLRVTEITVQQAVNRYLGYEVTEPWQLFAGLRSWKDNF